MPSRTHFVLQALRACVSLSNTIIVNQTTSVASGIQYQWQQATSATGPWTNATAGTGATTSSYLTGTIAATTWFRCIVTCAANGLTDTKGIPVTNF